MAQLTTASISIDGSPVNQFSSFSLSQGIYEHHFFRLTCPAESIDGSKGAAFSKSKTLMGATLTAQIDSVNVPGQLKFKGIITQVETERYSGSPGDVVITGYSPTIMLESGPHCKSWEKKAVKNIVQDVLSHFPQNMLKPKVAPVYPETLSYYVQYKETAWRFLSRICSTYGEWIYYDGEALIVAPPSGKSVPLIYGNNLSRFSMSLHVSPPGMQVMAYDYVNHEVYSSTPSGIEDKAGLNDLGKQARSASQAVYTTQPKLWNNNFLTNKKQLDDVVNIQSAMRSSNHVRINGSSGHPGVCVGGKITIKGQNMHNGESEDYGECTVISVNHYTDGQGNYSNDFTAIPASIKLPPVATIPEPPSETQSALVTDNHDPRGMGRIRVRFHWMKPGEKTPWLRVSSPHGGGGKGMFFIPEVGEEVIVGFEGNSPTKGYIDGTVYHGRANNTYGNAGNDVKALQTRSGNQVIMNDKDGSITIKDPSNNVIVLKGDGTIEINAPNKITLNTKEIEMNAEVSIKMQAGDGVATMSLEQAGSKTTITGDTMVQVHSDTEVSIDANTKTSVHGGSELALSSDAKASLGALTTDINGTTATTVKGGTVTLN
jgi:type VI secretion system secreted protein VgrG